jgi:hypothetical protein
MAHKRSTILGLLLTLIWLSLATHPASASSLGTFTSDENGHATWAPTGGPSVGVVGTPIFLSGGVTYDVSTTIGTPFGFAEWYWTEPGTSAWSDVIVTGITQFSYYSEPGGDLADLITLGGTISLEGMFPSATNPFGDEVGPEGNNHITFTILVGPDTITFNGISDVPEPSTLFLLGSVLAGFGVVTWRRSRTK